MPVYLVLTVALILFYANMLVVQVVKGGPFPNPGPEGRALWRTWVFLQALFAGAFLVGSAAALVSEDMSCAAPPDGGGGRGGIQPLQPPPCGLDLTASTEWAVTGPAFGVCAVAGGALIVVAVLLRRRRNHSQPVVAQHHRATDVAALREQPHSSGGRP